MYITKFIKGGFMHRLIYFFKKLFLKVESIFYIGSSDTLPEPLSKEMEDY